MEISLDKKTLDDLKTLRKILPKNVTECRVMFKHTLNKKEEGSSEWQDN